MRTLLALLMGSILFGCGSSETASTEPAKSTEAPKSAAGTGSGDAEHAKMAAPVSAELEQAQLEPFLTDLGKLGGHGGGSPEEVKEMLKRVTGIKQGDTETGSIHVDHGGKHADVILSIERLSETNYKFSFSAEDPKVLEPISEKLEAAKGK